MEEAMWLVALRTQATHLTARQLFSLYLQLLVSISILNFPNQSLSLLTLLIDSATFRHVH